MLWPTTAFPNWSLFGPIPSGLTHADHVNCWFARLGEAGMSRYPPDSNVKPVPTPARTNVIALDADGLSTTKASLLLSSPIHELTSPEGGATQDTHPAMVN